MGFRIQALTTFSCIVVLLGAVLAIGAEQEEPSPQEIAAALMRYDRIRLNESMVVIDLKNMASAQKMYASINGYFDRVECLEQPWNCIQGYPGRTPLLSESESEKWGYRRSFHSGPQPSAEEIQQQRASPSSMRSYAYVAVPMLPGVSGLHGFCIDETERVCYTADGAPAIENGKCSSSCSALPAGGTDALVEAIRPELTDDQRRKTLDALDTNPDFRNLPRGDQERVRSVLSQAVPRSERKPPEGRAYDGAIGGLAFSPDGNRLYANGGHPVKAWSVEEGRLLDTIPGICEYSFGMLITPETDTLVTRCPGAGVQLWSLRENQGGADLGDLGGGLPEFAASDDGRILATASGGVMIHWAIPSGERLSSWGQSDPGASGAVSPDLRQFARAPRDSGRIEIWTGPDGPGFELPEPSGKISKLAFTHDGGHLIGGYRDGTVAVWSLSEKRRVASHRAHGFMINDVAVAAKQKTLYTGSSDGTINVWSLPGLELQRTLRGHHDEVFRLALSPDEQLLASGDREGVILLWSTSDFATPGKLADPTLR